MFLSKRKHAGIVFKTLACQKGTDLKEKLKFSMSNGSENKGNFVLTEALKSSEISVPVQGHIRKFSIRLEKFS